MVQTEKHSSSRTLCGREWKTPPQQYQWISATMMGVRHSSREETMLFNNQSWGDGEGRRKPTGNTENDITELAHLPAHTAGETWDKQFCSSAPSVSGVKAFSLSSRLLERYVCQNTHVCVCVCGRGGERMQIVWSVSCEGQAKKKQNTWNAKNNVYTYIEREKSHSSSRCLEVVLTHQAWLYRKTRLGQGLIIQMGFSLFKETSLKSGAFFLRGSIRKSFL